MERNDEVELTQYALPRSGHIAIPFDKYMIIWGGYCDDPFDWYLPAEDFWIYDTEFRVWRMKKSDSPYPNVSSGSTACRYGDKVFVFGGHWRGGHTANFCHFDLRLWEWHQYSQSDHKSPSPRDKTVSWIYKNKFYSFGGYGLIKNECLLENGKFSWDELTSPTRGWNNQLVVFDLEEEEWSNPSCSGEVPCPRAAHAAAHIDNKVYVFGGRHQDQRLNDLHCLELDTLRWSGRLETGANTPEGRSWHTLSVLSKERLFLYGGFNTNCKPLSDGWILDISSLQWTQLTHLPNTRPRLWHTACVTPSQEVLLHGGCSNNILDYQAQTEHCSDVIHIQLQPYSLKKLCLSVLYENKEATSSEWSSLPKELYEHLKTRQTIADSLSKSVMESVINEDDNADIQSAPTCSVS